MSGANKELPDEIRYKLLQFNRVLMSYVDFQQAAGIAGHILKMNLHERYPEDRFLLQGLNFGMIVAYCRPFSGNDKGADVKVPDLPIRFLDVLNDEEREVHYVVMNDRKTVVAHSDSSAWQPRPHIQRFAQREIFIPMFNYAHAPLLREATEIMSRMCDKLMKRCFEHRRSVEAELRPYLPIVDVDMDEMRKVAEESGIPLPSNIENCFLDEDE